MNLNKERIRKHFDRHAKEYDRYAQVQQDLAEQLLEKVIKAEPSSARYRKILEIGCGTGYLTQMIAKQYPDAEIVVIDLSEEMIIKTKAKLAELTNKITYIIDDAEWLVKAQNEDKNSAITQSFDLIISNASFQWFNDPKGTVQGYLEYLVPNGVFAFSTFGPQTFHELHASFRKAEQQLNLPLAQHGQLFLSRKDWDEIIVEIANRLLSLEKLRIEVYPSVREFLYSVKRVGAGNAMDSKGKGSVGGRRLINLMEKYYAETFIAEHGIQATYHLYLGIYSKK